MNNAKLKAYAPQARRDFIAAVTAQAAVYGLGADHAEPMQQQGDVVLIGGRAFPGRVAGQRRKLEARIARDGFERVMEAIAYTWFNRCVALRYMELHGYLEHGYRVLSPAPHPDGGRGAGATPEILEQAEHVELPGLRRDTVIELKLDGTREAELYRLLLVAQCNALSAAMPFLFERIDDETELLLPDNLLRTDSVITQLVGAIPEEDWADIEIIGWLYQFYISEKKDQVIGKVVKSEDIPAATQLFTPNWIVQYLVQNSIGRLWLMANPASSLKSQWPYYIEPAEQTPEVQAQLDALIQTRMDEDGGSLNPETITCLDPACGSGHILVEAYEVLKGIYLERGYRLRDIPRLILEKNLYGLDIDDRAAQLAGFALLMKARADARRLLDSPIKLNVQSLQESAGLDIDEFNGHLKPHGIHRTVLGSLLDNFTHAKTFGSLIQVPKVLEDGLAGLEEGIAKAIESGDVFAKAAAQDLAPLVRQAKILAMKFDAVVANPPYMGSKGMNGVLKEYSKATFPDSKSDLFSMFIERGFGWCKPSGFNGMVTMQSWMFLGSFEELRKNIASMHNIVTLLHIGYNTFPELNSKIAQGCAFVIQKSGSSFYRGNFQDLNNNVEPSVNKGQLFISAKFKKYNTPQQQFISLPGCVLSYWMSNKIAKIFKDAPNLKSVGDTRQGMATSDNNRFLRLWHEVNFSDIGFNCKSREEFVSANKKWAPYNKGGNSIRWWGNQEFVINWANDGEEVIKYAESLYGSATRSIKSISEYFKRCISWSKISWESAFRLYPNGYIFDVAGCSIFFKDESKIYSYLAYLNSKVTCEMIGAISPTLNFEAGHVAALPCLVIDNKLIPAVNGIAERLINLHKDDRDALETSFDFVASTLCSNKIDRSSLSRHWELRKGHTQSLFNIATELETENNRIFIEAYGLQDELSPEVPESQITLDRADREKDSQRLISYAIGCMMGRYSLDEPGLIYAHAGNVGFDATRYKTFPADADGIIPVTDELWFEDDAANRIREFILAVWPASTFEENMAWLAESLGTKGNETPAETLRRYLASSFFKDHLQTYKKRPIYWLFSSGKQGAFQALVYLHRYHAGTLARMRTEYVIPLQGRMASRIEQLDGDIAAATSTAHAKQLQKQRDKLAKQRSELLAFDEKLRHYADQRITLDLDDGVKVNYGKFGDLLAEVKAVTGGKEDS